MNQMMERKRQRREYLRKKGTAYSITALYSGLCVALWVIAGVGLYNMLPLILWDRYGRIASIGVCLALVALAIGSTVYLRHSETEAKSVPFVPPVTASTLPANEILVRAVDEPPIAQSTVLLRAAQQGQETPKEELLRGAGKER